MKFACTLLVLCAASKVSPIEKTVELLASLQAKVAKDGEVAKKLYEEFLSYCEDHSKELQYSIKTGKAEIERQSATIADADAKISSASGKIDDLASSIATNEADLKAAQEIRAKEAKDFATADADLAETIDMLGRAVGIIGREGSSLMQTGKGEKLASVLEALVQATSVDQMDRMKLEALLQDDDSAPAGAPAAAAYESHSSGILSTLEDMQEKAQAQRNDAQKDEMNTKHNFQMLQQKLQDEVEAQSKELKETKGFKSEADEAKSMAEGELNNADTALKADVKELSGMQNECMSKAAEYQEDSDERVSELAALQKAKEILTSSTGGASTRAYSLMQLSSKDKDSKDRAQAFLQRLADDSKSMELAQLVLRVKAVAMDGEDPFGKVKGLIQDMIEKLVGDAKKEASHKAFCDEEMSETKAKKEDKEAELAKLGTKIDKATAKIAKLKEEVAALESQLADIAKQQQAATQLRAEEKEAWAAAKVDYTQGVEGVELALGVLRDYYASGDAEELVQTDKYAKASGSAGGIIGMLEVVMSDFSKLLAEGNMSEENSQNAYDKQSQENRVATMTKKTEAEYKVKDGKETESLLAGLTNDQGSAQTEFDAILDYWAKLQPMCIAKAEPYAERKRRREAEIAGLKEAMSILEGLGGQAFLQVRRA